MYGIFWSETTVQGWSYLTATGKTGFSTRNADIVTTVFDMLIVAVNGNGVMANLSYQESLSLPSWSDSVVETERETIVGFFESTTFILGVTISSFLCGLIILFAIVILRYLVGKLRRRSELSRGYAMRHVLHSTDSVKFRHSAENSRVPSINNINLICINPIESPIVAPRQIRRLRR